MPFLRLPGVAANFFLAPSVSLLAFGWSRLRAELFKGHCVTNQCVRSAVTVVPCPGGYAPQGKGRFPGDNGEWVVSSFMVWSLLGVLAVMLAFGAILRALRDW